ncbi:hypothetical protein [Nocardioides sp. CFH 31398]|uniref:hypothetical protein n=1 Tax=Nocardioides sp. CFH 31398 TaxID=2919579 RepID=UPI001F05EA61|nr:hypothetical protein [Nocardioides sp. CFH 31398]MCH1865307.1 hypothetical protein [Nocardioides sp. CFH 31398]
MISTSSRLLARRAGEAAAAAYDGATAIHGDASLRSAALDEAIGADDAAVLALGAVRGARDTLEGHVRAALAHADAVLALRARAAS